MSVGVGCMGSDMGCEVFDGGGLVSSAIMVVCCVDGK